jgi:hypothetical protein
MTTIRLKYILSLVLIILISACKKGENIPECIKIKLLFKDAGCNYMLFQDVDGMLSKELVQSELSILDTTYKNVFTKASNCNGDIPTSIKEGEILYIKINSESTIKDCPVCTLYEKVKAIDFSVCQEPVTVK